MRTHFAPAEKQLLARFWQSASGFWLGRSAWLAWFLVAVLIATVILQLMTQYALNSGTAISSTRLPAGIAKNFGARR